MSLKSLLAGAALALVFAAPPVLAETVAEILVRNPDLSTFVSAIEAAGLTEQIETATAVTVFAPTNEAFAKLPAGTVETLLKPENKDTLVKILTCHVVGAEVMSAALASMIQADMGTHPVETLGGCVLQASMTDGMVKLTDEQGNVATVTIADVKQSNGVIHVIDTVMLPKM